MKKKFFIALLIMTGIILSFFVSQDELYTELIINTHNNVDLSNISIFYSNINYNTIKPYSLKEDGLSPIPSSFVPYSEGFMSKLRYRQYKKALVQPDKPFSKMFQDYYETDDFVFFAFPGDLSSFLALERATGEVKPLIIDSSIFLSPMYVSHMQKVDNQLIILAGEANQYNALIYTVSLPTLKVNKVKHLKTHPSALSEPHFTLTPSGEALFIADYKLQVYNPFTEDESFIPLPFKATGVVSQSNTTMVYGEEGGKLHYAVLDNAMEVVLENTLTFPSSSSSIIDLILKDGYLYLALIDPLGARFRNYIVGYDLSTGQMTYCLGLEDAMPLALVSIQ